LPTARWLAERLRPLAMRRRDFAPYASEFVGTFFLVLTISLNVLQNHPIAPVSIGFMLVALIFSSGSVSGGHFNPAVTAGVWLSGRGILKAKTAGLYVAVQLLAGFLASLSCWGILGATFAFQPAEGYSWAEAALVESVYSSALVLVVLSTATLARPTRSLYQDEFSGLAIGLVVVAAAFACGAISGCCLNPALGVAMLGTHSLRLGMSAGRFLPVYTVCPLLGAAAAAAIFRVVRPLEYEYRVLKVERERREENIPDNFRESLAP